MIGNKRMKHRDHNLQTQRLQESLREENIDSRSQLGIIKKHEAITMGKQITTGLGLFIYLFLARSYRLTTT